jgi:hypothetical protein
MKSFGPFSGRAALPRSPNIRAAQQHRPTVFVWFVYFAVHLIRCGEGIYFLHFARKTFNPWAWIQN